MVIFSGFKHIFDFIDMKDLFIIGGGLICLILLLKDYIWGGNNEK